MMNFYAFVMSAEKINYAVGVILNLLLLYCIVYCNKCNLGKYRYLQILIVFVDTIDTTGQCFVRERFVTKDRMIAMVATGIVNDAESLCLYCAIYSLIFVLDDYSFLYRLWAVKYPHLIKKFSQPSFIFGLVFIAIVEMIIWFAFCYYSMAPSHRGREILYDEIFDKFGVDSRQIAMIMAECILSDGSYNGRTLVGIACAVAIIGFCITFMVYSIRSIYVYLQSASSWSRRSLGLQRQLFITLCVQTLIPFFALYLICGSFMTLPLIGVDASLVADLGPLFISFFLPLDALAVLITMTEYRREVMRLIGMMNPLHAPFGLSQMTFTSTVN